MTAEAEFLQRLRQPGGPAIALPAMPRATPGDLVAPFAAALAAAGADLVLAQSDAELDAALRERVAGRAIVTDARDTLVAFPLQALAFAATCAEPDDPVAFRRAAANAEVGVTAVHRAVATSGSLVLAIDARRPRLTSALPPHHVALVLADQLVPDLAAAFPPPEEASALVFVTGPSRTSDIENDLQIGVHGPAAVTVLLRLPAR